MLQPPLASEFDPAESDETSIDPLGLATTYARLADQMLGNVTARMTRIRLVTAIAVGTHGVIENDWDPNGLAAGQLRTRQFRCSIPYGIVRYEAFCYSAHHPESDIRS